MKKGVFFDIINTDYTVKAIKTNKMTKLSRDYCCVILLEELFYLNIGELSIKDKDDEDVLYLDGNFLALLRTLFLSQVEKECWDKLSLTLKELDTKLEDVKLKKIFWFIVFNIFVFWNEDNNFIILQVRKFVDKRDLDRLNLSLKDYSGTIKKLIHKLRTEDSFVVGHYILNILNNKILISKDNNSVEIYKDKKVDSGYFGIVYLRHAFLDKDKYK